jgi:hypothetical protein
MCHGDGASMCLMVLVLVMAQACVQWSWCFHIYLFDFLASRPVLAGASDS